MKTKEVIDTIVRFGIEPTLVFKGLKCLPTPGLRAPTARELGIIRSFTMMELVGADSPMAPVFPGWNVWAVWQVQDLPFSVMMVGVSRDDQLKIWVEDHVRLEAPEAKVADPLDLKGSQVQILNGAPTLKVAMRKEQVAGPAMTIETQDLPPQLRYVRFFNRGGQSQLPWPHDESYLLDAVFLPESSNPTTQGPGPGTIVDNNITKHAGEAGKAALETALVVGLVAAVGLIAVEGFKHRK